MSKVLFAGVAACAVLVGWTTIALAQSAPASTEKVTAVGEVIVTAERRAQSVQQVDIALTVLAGKNLQKLGVVNINDLQNATPSLEVEPAFGGGEPQFRIRGVGFQDYASNNAPTVGVYVNEVAYPIPIMTEGAFFDVSRIEVLRGPQGTLYGRNTTGGAVNVITNQPTASYHAGVDVEYGSYNATHVDGYVSGPIAPDLTARLAAVTDQGGAYQFNQYTGQKFGNVDKFGERLLMDWTPTSKLAVKLDVHGFEDHSDGNGLYLFEPFQTNSSKTTLGPIVPASSNHYATASALDPFFAHDIGVSQNTTPFRHSTQWGTSVNISYDFGAATLVNIASYDVMDRKEFQDWAPSQYPEADVYFHTKPEVVSDELRLISNGNGPLSWITGIYYSYQHMQEAYLSDFLDVYGVALGVHYHQDVSSIAGFGQAEYKLNSQWIITGGLRLENEKRSLDGFNTEILAGTTAIPYLPSSNASTTMTPLTGKLAVNYKPQDNLLFYVSISKGVKSGGFTTYNTGNAAGISPFKPETLWSYEGGFKWTLLPTYLHLNGAAFHYAYTDQQVLSVIFPSPNTPVGHFVNVPRSHIDGGELELTGEILPHLSISQELGYKIGTYDNFPDAENVQTGALESLSGTKIPFPKLSYEGDVSYWVPVADSYKLEGDFNYSYHDVYPSWLGTIYTVPSYWLANVNLTFSPMKGNWSLGLFVDNVFNQEYDLTRNFFIPEASVAAPGRPRTIGGRLTANF